MHIWVCACAFQLVYVSIQAAASVVCVRLNAKLPPINTVVSLHLLTKQHDAPKTHYPSYSKCAFYTGKQLY